MRERSSSRHGGHQVGVVAGAAPDLGQLVGVGQALCGKKCGGGFATKTGGALARDARHGVVGGADPEAAVVLCGGPALAQPVRQADVVGVHVRHHHPQNRQAFQLVGKNAFPLGFGCVVRNAAVHGGPALTAVLGVAQQPEVDVVECKRQRHAQPLDTRRHHERPAGLGQRLHQRVVQARFELLFVWLHGLAIPVRWFGVTLT